MSALKNVLDKDFVRWFLIEQKHTYKELVTEIKARYQNLKGKKRKRQYYSYANVKCIALN